MDNLKPIDAWGFGKSKPFVIAGPCSVETPKQLRLTIGALPSSVTMLRGGIWKPRTRPNTFEGVGEPALLWLQEAKQEVGLPAAVEVANAYHVELALEYEMDAVWIGARSTVNPFTVQEIADALRGVDIPVMVKNPINPDLALWIGALERVYQAGIRRLAAIHRGFSSYGEAIYRNTPTWQIPIDLKSQLPDLPLICDPSHIGGNRSMIAPLAQKALDLNYDGLMIETHCDPDRAWSDAKQQITPAQLGELIIGLILRSPSSANPDFQSGLAELRRRIDRKDQEILSELAQRMKAVLEIGEYKMANGVQIFQAERWLEITRTRPMWAEEMELSGEFAQKLYKLIHDESIRLQTQLMRQKEQPKSETIS